MTMSYSFYASMSTMKEGSYENEIQCTAHSQLQWNRSADEF